MSTDTDIKRRFEEFFAGLSDDATEATARTVSALLEEARSIREHRTNSGRAVESHMLSFSSAEMFSASTEKRDNAVVTATIWQVFHDNTGTYMRLDRKQVWGLAAVLLEAFIEEERLKEA